MQNRRFVIVAQSTIAMTLTAILLLLLSYHRPIDAISKPDIRGASNRPIFHTPTQTVSNSTGYRVDIVPLNGESVFITVTGGALTDTKLFADVAIGPGHVKHSYAMTKAESSESHYVIAAGFSPSVNTSALLTVTTVDSQLANLNFDRGYVPRIEEGRSPHEVTDFFQRIGLYIDGGTFTDESYLIFIPNPTAMPPIPKQYTLVGNIYDINGLNDMSVTDKSMELRFYPDGSWLGTHAVQTLAILRHDPIANEWLELPSGRRVTDREQRVALTPLFTAYALVASQTWADPFDYLDGLENPQDVRLAWPTGESALMLDAESTSAVVKSVPIDLPSGGFTWSSVDFRGDENPPTTSLQIDLLDRNGAIVFEDITPQTDLSNIDAANHSKLRLQVTLLSEQVGESPTLHEWSISWKSEETQEIYLPIILR